MRCMAVAGRLPALRGGGSATRCARSMDGVSRSRGRGRTMVVRASGAFDNDMAKAMEKTFGMGEGKRVSWAFSTTQVPQVEVRHLTRMNLSPYTPPSAERRLVRRYGPQDSKRALVVAPLPAAWGFGCR